MKTKALNKERRDYFDNVYEGENPLLDWNFGTASHKLVELVIDGTIKRGSSVLDIGSGPGTESIFLAKQGMDVTGLDINSEAIELAKKLADLQKTKVRFVNGDALETDFDDKEFDVANDTFVFHHFEPSIRQKYASEINRILKPGGLFILRGFSDKMTPGSGPFRLTSKDILDAFTPYFSVEHLSRFRNIPTEKRPDQWHWLGVFSKKS